MSKCIICKKNPRGSKEHIIPSALGNKEFITYSLCEKCNNTLGSKVDSHLTQNAIVTIHKWDKGLSKQKYPFKKMEDDEGKTVHLNDTSMHYQPYLLFEGKEFTGRARNEQEAKQMIIKNLQRNFDPEKKLPDEELMKKFVEDYSFERTRIESLTLHYNIKINYLAFSAAFIKIAYEYAFEILGEKFLEDKMAADMRAFLTSAMVNSYENRNIQFYPFVEIFIGTNELIENKFGICHIICLIPAGDKVVVGISIYGAPYFSFGIVVSENSRRYGKVKSAIHLIQVTTGKVIAF